MKILLREVLAVVIASALLYILFSVVFLMSEPLDNDTIKVIEGDK